MEYIGVVYMAELANCSNCNAVFAKSMRDICQACFHEEEAAFKIVYLYLTKRKNREATLNEIVEATEVEEKLIIKFIKERRLRTSQFPNLGYPCEKCGENIVTGKLCKHCSEELIADLEHDEQIKEREKEKEREKSQIYYSITKDR